jgi:hypothetical protein
MFAHVRLGHVTGISLSRLPNATGVFLRVSLSPTGVYQKTKTIPKGQPCEFKHDIASFEIKEKEYPKFIIEYHILAKPPQDDILVADLSIPMRACPRGSCIRENLEFNTATFYSEKVTGVVTIHVVNSRSVQPFTGEKVPIPPAILKQSKLTVAARARAGEREKSPDKPKIPLAPPPPGDIITPVQALPAEVVDAVEAAMATLPPEAWPLFAAKEFIRDGLVYAQVFGTPES